MNEECPITPNVSIHLRYGDDSEDYLVISSSHDSIQKFTNPDYTYLRYYDHNEGDLRAVWLSEDVLNELNTMGIPITNRESITEVEYEAYQRYVGKVALSTVSIDEVIEQEIINIDSELNYYMKEWE